MRNKRNNNANKAGKGIEEALAAFMRVFGWEFTEQVKVGPSTFPKHGVLVVDFVVRNLQNFPRGLILESKWQGRRGSVDEKFPCLFLNLRACEIPSIVIASGGGCRPGAVDWLKEHCDHDHLFAVLTLDEFFKWALHQEKQEVDDAHTVSHRAINA